MLRIGMIGMAAVMAASLAGCKPKPLPPELAAIRCPSDRQEHVEATYAPNVHVQHVCLTATYAAQPELFRCRDLESGRVPRGQPCRDEGNITLSRTEDHTVYEGGRHLHYGPKGKGDGPERVAEMNVNFSPVTRPLDWNVGHAPGYAHILEPEGLPLPPGFAVDSEIDCAKASSVLASGGCTFVLRSPTMFWRVYIPVKRPAYTPISEEEYRHELAFFLPYLVKMVRDGGPAGAAK